MNDVCIYIYIHTCRYIKTIWNNFHIAKKLRVWSWPQKALLWLPYFLQQGLTWCADWSTIKAQNAMAHYSLASIGLLASLRAAMCAVKSCVVSVVIALFPPAGIDIMCWLVHYQGTKCNGTLFPCKHRSSGQLASCYVCSQILCCERCDCLISTSRYWHHVLTGPLSRHKMQWHTIPLQA